MRQKIFFYFPFKIVKYYHEKFLGVLVKDYPSNKLFLDRRFRKIAKIDYQLRHIFWSVHPSACLSVHMQQLG